METVRHHGRETAYRTAGDPSSEAGAAVLYVHGSGATHRLWAAQYGPDGPARPAAALDLSGHGDSADVATDPGPETLDAYARDVIAVAEETGADALVGNSLGGAVALRVALDTEFDPGALVLAGTGAKLAVDGGLREWLAGDFDRAVDFLHGENRLFHDADERTLDRSRSQMRATGRAVTRRDFLTCHAFDVRERLGEVDAPALAVVGERDSLTPPSYHEFLAEELPDCEYVEIPDAAHLAMVERPEAFGRAVGRFLDGLGG
ncbi:alpha/beta hydrolase [Halosimplex rubrum]|uniref:Alpha/beta hydrolase n=1 Tax=Halosimplex rubrum TaxID=869889 RepID=A0A7D5P233_9EURY|nr:alpha/beta hydrolase [Halosimplex rubrum]QLH79023.1 alpha/beta hydrolase [Halosimplex rubrum]